jgi:elongation factor 2
VSVHFPAQVYPDKGTVSFSAGLHAWAFTLTTFAQMYAAKFGTAESKMMEKLWGDNFFDPATKKWTKKATDSKTCQRGFVQFCYNPIKQVRRQDSTQLQHTFSGGRLTVCW